MSSGAAKKGAPSQQPTRPNIVPAFTMNHATGATGGYSAMVSNDALGGSAHHAHAHGEEGAAYDHAHNGNTGGERKARVVFPSGQETERNVAPAEEDTFDPTLTEVDLTAHDLTSIPPNLLVCRGLEKLSLRQNKLTDIKALSAFPQLSSLDLYENQLHLLGDALRPLKKLKWLDLSFNGMRHIHGLEEQKQVTKLYLIQNKITAMENLNHLSSLRLLELGSNRIRAIANIDRLTALRELWLGRNKITSLEGLGTLVNLEKLSLQSNRLVEIGDGLRHCTKLTELYLSHNGIRAISGLQSLTALRILDMAANRIHKLENVSHLHQLQELWLNDNLIADYADLKQLRDMTQLTTLYLEKNPLQEVDDYQERVLAACPRLHQLDALELVEEANIRREESAGSLSSSTE